MKHAVRHSFKLILTSKASSVRTEISVHGQPLCLAIIMTQSLDSEGLPSLKKGTVLKIVISLVLFFFFRSICEL